MYGEVSGESDCEAIEFYTCIFLKNAIGYIEKRRQCKGDLESLFTGEAADSTSRA